MAHQYAHLCKQNVQANISYYLAQHPEVAHMPIENVIKAFKEGFNNEGLLDTHLPDLSRILTQLPNSNESLFAERLRVEALSQDLGDANIFFTMNMDPRAWPDVHRLVYRLEHGYEMSCDSLFEKDTTTFTKLMYKYAMFISVYLSRKAKMFFKAFFGDVCGIPKTEPSGTCNREKTGWY